VKGENPIFFRILDGRSDTGLPLRFALVQNAGSMAAGEKASAVERALLILEVLDSSRRGLNISELSRRLRLPKSSTHVIVLTLERLGYVQKTRWNITLQPGPEGIRARATA
jgi:hypothetical protein